MIEGLAAASIACALVAGAACVVQALRDRAVGVGLLAAAGVAELVLLAQVVGAVAELAGGQRAEQPAVFVLYLIGSVVALPLGAWWSLGDRSRWGSGVLAVACFAVAIIVVRLGQVWG
ncbi:conserved membrane hypothetical protein [Frankia canadensis]|uniref:Integral membrane protein n=1 Tax=Frankia canadensis TaxID=1836972 RepID=A0A2I2KSY9_9ACTN|nr:hypothetical protein [Frankia canadensis]SNQ48784.1 conserved membrane hypothetical protein [Frankia canadensis]SOU56074.1 conserved membrane hypothetical protein [Frankia canadensis]